MDAQSSLPEMTGGGGGRGTSLTDSGGGDRGTLIYRFGCDSGSPATTRAPPVGRPPERHAAGATRAAGMSLAVTTPTMLREQRGQW